MFTQIQTPNSYFKAYYEDNAILIQFIIVEFVQVHQLIFKVISSIQQQIENTPITKEEFSSVRQILEELIGRHFQQEPSISSMWLKGSLTKFKEYCEQFSRNASCQKKTHCDLHLAVHQTWLVVIHHLEFIHSLTLYQDPSTAKLLSLKSSFKQISENLKSHFEQVIKFIPRLINDYWNNENVMFCLLRKKNHFIEIYGLNFLNKPFKWRREAKDLINLLMMRYQSRGYHNLLSNIEQIYPQEQIAYDIP